MGSELKKAIDQISKDRGIDRDLLVDTLEEAVRSSVARKYGDAMDIEVNYNEDIGEIEVYQFKVVAEEVTDEISEIVLSEAKEHDPNVQVDDEMGFKLKIEDLGRIAAQSAKQVIIQRMRDAEQEIIYDEYKSRKNEIVSGIIQRRDRSGWIINLGRTEAVLPKNEQIPRERYKRGDRVQAFLIDVQKEARGPQITVSRSHPDYMTALFKREVPEVDDDTVKIMGVARDPGLRAKVAVNSLDRDVDPVGACVGIRGSRIQNIVQELRGERIDIVVWSQDIAVYAQNALSPAIISRIAVDDDEKILEVVVPDDQLTVAIGRKGQNVKLASRLLGWKIDIFTESRYGEMNAASKGMDQLASVAEINLDNFISAGFETVNQIARASEEILMTIENMTPSKVADIKSAIKLLGMGEDEESYMEESLRIKQASLEEAEGKANVPEEETEDVSVVETETEESKSEENQTSETDKEISE
ncbi:NusA antitermination factor [Maridesulfovibrio ferrireducens]|uniref:Transcription termination/antitermination protein NusA n=1 Tax=Maridesulfovibrio ferrireducens TaxID=246191 RepID=A0A1G9JG84_9BACT|nr:transcription termination factor NusA [Maridesulfovibrio ferrireducens]SDL36133.1 NusA antitermination factor [Maridesulfovibrio ferrireducens]